MHWLFAWLGGVAVALTSVSADAARIPPDPASVSYQQGSSDRDSWEAWFNGLTGGKRDGANFWTEQRSLRAPIPCGAYESQQNGMDWMAGCNEAKQRLTSSDYLRRADPQYWNGWNKLAAQPVDRIPDVVSSKLLAGPPPQATQPVAPQPQTQPNPEPVIAQWTGTP